MVAERQDLIALALEGVAEKRAIDDETAADGFALRLISLKTNVHKLIYNWTIIGKERSPARYAHEIL